MTYIIDYNSYNITIKFTNTLGGTKCIFVVENGGDRYEYSNTYMYFSEKAIIYMIIEKLNTEFSIKLDIDCIIDMIINKYNVTKKWKKESKIYM